jgi:hypothetical protein
VGFDERLSLFAFAVCGLMLATSMSCPALFEGALAEEWYLREVQEWCKYYEGSCISGIK